MNNVINLAWQGIYFNTMELVTLEKQDNYIAKGRIVGEAKGVPLRLSYELIFNSDWDIEVVKINQLETTDTELYLKKDKQNRWYDSRGNHLMEYHGCEEVDISLTPFTNTLPINKFKLAEGHQREMKVLYINLPSNEIKVFQQKYTNLGGNRYKYENLSTSYKTVIEVDDNGFVIKYPGVWERILKSQFLF